MQATVTDLNAALTNLAYLSVTNYHGPDWLNLKADAVGTAPGALPAGTSNGLALQVTNYAPVAQADNYACSYNRVFRAATTEGVLANDSDVNGDLLTASLVSSTLHGSIFLSTNGGFTFLPDVNFSGQDCFTYRVFDGVQYTTNTAVIGLSPANDQPTLSPVQVLLMETDSSTNLSFAAFDPDGNTIYWIARATNFTVQDGLQTRQVTVAIAETGDVYANGYPCLVWDCAMRCQVYERYTDSHGSNAQAYYKDCDGYQITISVTRYPPLAPVDIWYRFPTNEATFAEHHDIPLNVGIAYSECDWDGRAIDSVEFYCGTNFILVQTNPPFDAIWTNGPNLAWSGSATTTNLTLSAVLTCWDYSRLYSQPVTIAIQRDRDWDGFPDQDELHAGTDPDDYYNGNLPSLGIAGGNFQIGPPSQTLTLPLQVQAKNGSGSPLYHALLVFSVPPGGGALWDPAANGWTNSLFTRTDASGVASATFQLPNATNVLAHITAAAQTGTNTCSVVFTAASCDGTGAVEKSFLNVYTPLE